MVKCRIPNTGSFIDQISSCLTICNEIDSSIASGLVEIDMSDLDWISPITALLLSSKIMEAKTKARIKLVSPSNHYVRSYLTIIGFPLGGGNIGLTYCPIHHVKTDINKEGATVLKVINKNFPESVRGNIAAHLVSEFCDNIDQHSHFSQASVMAQFYPQKNRVELGFLDNGISIPGSFKSINIKFDEDFKAIDSALKGVSTKYGGSRGKGLPSSNRLICEGLKGELYIVSRQGAVLLDSEGNRKLFKLENKLLNGTLGYMRFTAPSKKVDVYDYIS